MRESRNPNITSEVHETTSERLPIRVKQPLPLGQEVISRGAAGHAITFTGKEVIFETRAGTVAVPLSEITGVDFAPSTVLRKGHIEVRTTVRRALFDWTRKVEWGGYHRKETDATAREFVEALNQALVATPEFVVTRESE